jgi:hypothetical protein
MRSKRRGSFGPRDGGAVAIETALISMFLITLMFGIIESSFLFKDYLAVSAAARSGARMGASEPRDPTFAQDSADQVTNSLSSLRPANLQEVWVYKTTSATGLPDSGSFASCGACVKFTWSAGPPGKLVQSYGNWDNLSQNACAGDPARDSLGVYVKYRHTSPLGFFFNNATVAENTVMWVEPLASNSICKP